MLVIKVIRILNAFNSLFYPFFVIVTDTNVKFYSGIDFWLYCPARLLYTSRLHVRQHGNYIQQTSTIVSGMDTVVLLKLSWLLNISILCIWWPQTMVFMKNTLYHLNTRSMG